MIARPRMPISLFVRIFIVGSVAVGACVYAIWRHVAVPRPPMLVPVPAETTLPAPELTPE